MQKEKVQIAMETQFGREKNNSTQEKKSE